MTKATKSVKDLLKIPRVEHAIERLAWQLKDAANLAKSISVKPSQPIRVDHWYPIRTQCGGVSHIIIHGENFDEKAGVELKNASSGEKLNIRVTPYFIGTQQINAFFEPSVTEPGSWTVVVTHPDRKLVQGTETFTIKVETLSQMHSNELSEPKDRVDKGQDQASKQEKRVEKLEGHAVTSDQAQVKPGVPGSTASGLDPVTQQVRSNQDSDASEPQGSKTSAR